MEPMSFLDFMNDTGYDINRNFVNQYWSIMTRAREGIFFELNEEMMQQLGFSNNPNLIKKLESLYPTTVEEREHSGGYFGDHVNVHIELDYSAQSLYKRYSAPRKKIYMTGLAYKEVLMESQTFAAKEARRHLIELEMVLYKYMNYQQCQNNRLAAQNDELHAKVDKQTLMLEEVITENQLKTQTLVRILYNESAKKVLPPTNEKKKQQLAVFQERNDPTSFAIIRGQNEHIERMKKRMNDQMEEVATIDSYMNPINLYNRFTEHVKGDKRFKVSHNKVIVQDDTSAQDLLDIIDELDDQKYDVARAVQQAL
jgi:Protein of unknown function (DUF3627)